MIVNHEGQSENLLGMVVNSEEEAYKLYNEYAMQTGFSIRKNKIIYSKNGIRQRECVFKRKISTRQESL